MTFDPRHFHPMLVADTCSVWNVLSSSKLFTSAFGARLTFCVTGAVFYECVLKPRKNWTNEMRELRDRLERARKGGQFQEVSCDLDDLAVVSAMAPIALSSGELSCIAAAHSVSTFAFMTDERQARIFASDRLSLRVETTPRLYGWLHYHRHLIDSDHGDVISEHEIYERRPLTKYLEIAYEAALQYRLMSPS